MDTQANITQPKPDVVGDGYVTIYNQIIMVELMSIIEAEDEAAKRAAANLKDVKDGEREEFIANRTMSPLSMWMNFARDKMRAMGMRVPTNAVIEMTVEHFPPEPMNITLRIAK